MKIQTLAATILVFALLVSTGYSALQRSEATATTNNGEFKITVSDGKTSITKQGAFCTLSGLELQKQMRKLWSDHVEWTKDFIVSSSDNLSDKKHVTDRLLNNQEDIGNAIKPLYGEQDGNKLTALLKQHILIAADVLYASKEVDQKELQDAQAKWVKNADEIATLLSSLNPNWKKEEMRKMLMQHLTLTTQQAQARLEGDYTTWISSYDKVKDQAMGMADMLSDGIIKQFPDKF